MSNIDAYGNKHKSRGIAGAGQFDGKVNSPPAGLEDTSTVLPPGVDSVLQRRAQLIEEGGFVPATSGFSIGHSTRTTDGIEQWWDDHFTRAEQAPKEGGTYLQMPDDYTPARTGGRSLSRKRRTHRMLYQGAGVAVRMPSATAIKRFSKENKYATFDVPVQVEGRGGQTYSGYVRVTQNGPDSWTTEALGVPPRAAWKVSESVNAVLESRRPSMALATVGDLLERRRERFSKAGAPLGAVENSTFIRGAGYNRASGEMVVTLGKRTYGYKVPEEAYQRLARSYSPGHLYNSIVKGSPRVPVAKCGTCSRWFNEATKHTCMGHKARTRTVKPYNSRVRAYVLEKAH